MANSRRASTFNWPLLLGSLLVIAVLAIAIAGPRLAPRDPMETNTVLQIEGKWLNAPLPPGTPGFPLGTDELGRDLFSRLLWAVRPTMIVVSLAALLRLLIGTGLGLLSGWSARSAGRLLDSLISGVLALPALLVALATVAVLQGKLGMWSYILGLVLTGWAESARLVREQTRAIRGQSYIEAARALGGSDLHIVLRHVLRQIMPMLWMLLSFEVSSSLLIIAGLGFLGYFVGGEVWIAISDFVAARYTGAPELGQMLQTDSGELFAGPWKIFATGSAVFLIILGFNLLGEGLRLQTMQELKKRTLFSLMGERLEAWMEEHALPPLSTWSGRQRGALLASLLLVLLLGGMLWQRVSATPEVVEEPLVDLTIPGGHLWPSEYGDAHGTRWREAEGPGTPGAASLLWTFQAAGGLAGGPAIAADGTLYLAGRAGLLYKISPEGRVLWEVPLPATPVGGPALGAEGHLYVADALGGLTALTPDGTVVWQYTIEESLPAGAGPIVAPDGTIYYTVGSGIQALAPEGKPLWREIVTRAPVRYPPQLSPAGDLLLLERGAVDAKSGASLERPLLEQLRPLQYFVGADGWLYLRHDNHLVQWRPGTEDIEVMKEAEWPSQRFAGVIPRDSGVTRDHVVWMVAWNPFNDARLFWLDMRSGELVGAGSAIYPHRPSTLLAIDGNDIMYTCGFNLQSGPECLAITIGSEEPLWQMRLPSGGEVNGGAMVPGRLYVSTIEGFLYAIGER